MEAHALDAREAICERKDEVRVWLHGGRSRPHDLAHLQRPRRARLEAMCSLGAACASPNPRQGSPHRRRDRALAPPQSIAPSVARSQTLFAQPDQSTRGIGHVRTHESGVLCVRITGPWMRGAAREAGGTGPTRPHRGLAANPRATRRCRLEVEAVHRKAIGRVTSWRRPSTKCSAIAAPPRCERRAGEPMMCCAS